MGGVPKSGNEIFPTGRGAVRKLITKKIWFKKKYKFIGFIIVIFTLTIELHDTVLKNQTIELSCGKTYDNAFKK